MTCFVINIKINAMSHELISAVQEINAAREAIRERYSLATDPLFAKDYALRYLKADHRELIERSKVEPLEEEAEVVIIIDQVILEMEKGNSEPLRAELKKRSDMFLEDDNPDDIQLGIAFINLADSII